jgi:Tfp pilus assembly protein PilO
LNSERLKELLKKIPVSMLFALFVVYLGYQIYSFYNDNTSPFNQKKLQITQSRTENAQVQNKIKQLEEFYKSLDQKRTELRVLAKQLQDLKGTLSETIDIPLFISMVLSEANRAGVTVMGIKPTESKTSEFYAEQDFQLDFKCVYIQLLVFIEHLAQIERILRVDNVELKPVGPSTSNYVEIGGNIEIKSFRYVGTQADEIAKNPGEPQGTPAVPAAGSAPGTTTAPATGAAVPALTAPNPRPSS